MRDSIRNFRITSILIITLFLVSYIGTLPLDLLDIDSSQYGEITREMTESGDYTRITDNGRKYLDKPVLTFWILSPFFNIFGANNFAYRLPSLLALLVGACGIFWMIHILFLDERRAWIGSISYLASPGAFAMVLDPKIDIYLTTFLILTHLFYFLGRLKSPRYFYLMYLSIGLGFITKGPISLVIPALSIGLDILMRRDWKTLLGMKILPGILVSGFFPLFWSYLLYREYSTYGPAFFLWIQSFGRFYKDLYDVALDPLFFLETFIWSFGGLGLVLAFQSLNKAWSFYKLHKLSGIFQSIRDSKHSQVSYVFGFWLYLFLFLISFSRFQLPQYVYWALPAASVIFSGFFIESDRSKIRYPYLYGILGGAFLVSTILLIFSFFPNGIYHLWIPGLLLVFSILIVLIGFRSMQKEFIMLMGGTAIGFAVVSLSIYPALLEFQPSKKIAQAVMEREPDEKIFYTYRISNSMRSLAFYSERIFRNVYDKEEFLEALETSPTRLILVPEEYIPEMKKYLGADLKYEEISRYSSAKLAIPKRELFLHDRRKEVLKELVLFKVSKLD